MYANKQQKRLRAMFVISSSAQRLHLITAVIALVNNTQQRLQGLEIEILTMLSATLSWKQDQLEFEILT